MLLISIIISWLARKKHPGLFFFWFCFVGCLLLKGELSDGF